MYCSFRRFRPYPNFYLRQIARVLFLILYIRGHTSAPIGVSPKQKKTQLSQTKKFGTSFSETTRMLSLNYKDYS